MDNNGCYWLTRRGRNGATCASACATYLANLEAAPNGGNGSPASIASYYFLCTDTGNYADAITISFDGITLDPAIVFASNNGNMNPSMCYCAWPLMSYTLELLLLWRVRRFSFLWLRSHDTIALSVEESYLTESNIYFLQFVLTTRLNSNN